jgi:hypothetical protein
MTVDRVRLRVAVLVASALHVATAAAGPREPEGDGSAPNGAEAISLVYEAPPGCPAESVFVGAVERDGGRLARATAGMPAREFRVVLEREGDVTGRLVVRDGPSSEVVRTLRGHRCEDVALALAVSAALALEPRSHSSPLASSATAPAEVSAPAPAPTPGPAPSDGEPDDGLQPLPPGWRLGVSAEAAFGGLGSASIGLASYVEVIRDTREGFAPALRLGLAVDKGDGDAAVDATGARVGWLHLSRTVGRLDACPARWVLATPWSPSPFEAWVCARLDAGVVGGVDPGGRATADTHRTWVAAGSLAHLRWILRRVFLDVEGGVMLPLVRARFVVEPATTLYEIPAVTGTGGVGVGVFFL